ncbi:hypothetical protein SAMN05880501_108118 [Ureibacillus xyleni]|uniref:Uncharacterized protein n=1 Tax=Ureibacillus xyleni TaxID=614648 RepID=A0A285T2Y4_9BACL|nr:hypothetical protein [Ureibacillus xyleni]SOC15626.1 hypothetical protein SAMN05880501_108118 [Ureibacillus xyleni]
MLSLSTNSLYSLLLNCMFHKPTKNDGVPAVGIIAGNHYEKSTHLHTVLVLPELYSENVTGAEFDLFEEKALSYIDCMRSDFEACASFESTVKDTYSGDDLEPINEHLQILESGILPYKVKVLLVLSNEPKKALTIERKCAKATKYTQAPKSEFLPYEEPLNHEFTYISGYADQYYYEIRAYKLSEQHIENISIQHSEDFTTKEKPAKMKRKQPRKFVLLQGKRYKQIFVKSKKQLLAKLPELMIRFDNSNEYNSSIGMYKVVTIKGKVVHTREVFEDETIEEEINVEFNLDDLLKGYIEDITLCRIMRYPIVLMEEDLY